MYATHDFYNSRNYSSKMKYSSGRQESLEIRQQVNHDFIQLVMLCNLESSNITRFKCVSASQKYLHNTYPNKPTGNLTNTYLLLNTLSVKWSQTDIVSL